MFLKNKGVATTGRICCGAFEKVKFYTLIEGEIKEIEVIPYSNASALRFYEVPNNSIGVIYTPNIVEGSLSIDLVEKHKCECLITRIPCIDYNIDNIETRYKELEDIVINEELLKLIKTECLILLG